MTESRALVPREPSMELAPALEQAGVSIATDESGRFRSLSFPEDVRSRFNLLLPVQEIVQADPNYTPTLRAVRLDPSKDGQHFYNQSGKLAPRKQALEVLADAAGVRVSRARPLSRQELSAWEEGTIGFEATVVLRRSDGTSRTITASKTWEPSVEKFRIEGEVAAQGKSEEEAKREFRKRWLAENQHKAAKTESKAILRAIRSALQIPHTFSAAEAARPFIVVGYSYTPDYSDPEVVRLVTERQLGAAEEVYPSAGRLEITAGSEAARDGASDESSPPAPAQGEEARASQPAASSPPVLEQAPEPAFAGEEPPEEETADEPRPGEEREEADPGAYVLPEQFKKHAGKPLSAVFAADPGYVSWLASTKVSDPYRSAAQAFLEAELSKETS